MARKRSRTSPRVDKEGMAPGTPVYTGSLVQETVTVDVFHYDGVSLREFVPTDLAELSACRAAKEITWVNVSGIHHVQTVEKVCQAFGVHPLAVEDICSVDTRAKAEEYEDHLYLVVKMLTVEKQDGHERIHAEHTSVVVGAGFVLTFQEAHDGDVFDPVRRRIRDARGRIRSAGADYLAYALIDAVVDHYFNVLEWVGDTALDLEESLLSHPGGDQLASIYMLRRELTFFRKQVWPLRDGLGLLLRSDNRRISREVAPFIRDVYDHTVQVVETIELYREMVLGLVDLHMTNVSNKMNEVMKLLTVIATIFIPLTFVAGIYGMNFDDMPELHWRYGYLMVWGLMLGMAAGMFAWFRHRKWV